MFGQFIWLRIENLKPVRFYRYTSGVNYRVLSQNYNYKTSEHDFLESLGNNLKNILPKEILWDNKVVVECELIHQRKDQKATSNLFIGCYDGIWSVGLGVWSDEWINPIEL